MLLFFCLDFRQNKSHFRFQFSSRMTATLTVRTMHELSLIAPQQPKKAIKNTAPPMIIIITGAVHKLSPGN